jgi:site-specific recombinase XerD
MELCKLKECNLENLKLLEKFSMLSKNKGNTEESIKGMVGNDLSLFLRYLKNKNIVDIDHKTIEDFLMYCQNERENCTGTLDRKYTSLNVFFNTMILKEYLPIIFKNPMLKIDKIKVRKKVS